MLELVFSDAARILEIEVSCEISILRFLSDQSWKENERLYDVVVARHWWFVEFSTLFG